MAQAPLGQDVRLRKALALAIDRDRLVETITQGGEAPAYEWVPSGVPDYEAKRLDFAAMTQADRRQQAQTLMTEAGYGPNNRLKLDVLYNTSERNQAIVTAIADQWRETLGVETTLTAEDWDAYLARRRQGQFQVARAAWLADSSDPLNFLGMFASGDKGRNEAGYGNVQFDRLIADAIVDPDLRARNDRLARAEEVLLADLPIIPIYHYGGATLVSRKVQGVVENSTGFHLTRYISKE